MRTLWKKLILLHVFYSNTRSNTRAQGGSHCSESKYLTVIRFEELVPVAFESNLIPLWPKGSNLGTKDENFGKSKTIIV